MKKLLAIACVLAMTAPVFADFAVEASQNATVQPAGNRSVDYYFNIEGSSNGSYASYGGMRFDTAAVKAYYDGEYGAGNWYVTDVSLELTQNNSGFTTNGDVDIYWSGDDVTTMAPGATTGGHWPLLDGDNDFTPLEYVDSYYFTEVSTGYVESHNINHANVFAEIENGELLTVILNDADANVAATYSGYTNTSVPGAPTIVVSALPEPASLALLAIGGLALIRRRR